MAESLKNKTIKGVTWSFLGSFSNQFLTLVFGIVLARLLAPSDYGLIALTYVFVAISNTFVDSGFSVALVRKEGVKECDYCTALFFNVIVAVFCYSVIFFIAPYAASFYNNPLFCPVLRVVSLSVIINSLGTVQYVKYMRNIDFKRLSIMSIGSNLIGSLIGLVLAYLHYGVWALVFQTLTTTSLITCFYWTVSNWRPREHFSKESFLYLFGFGSKLLASGLLNVIFNNIYPIIIGKLFSTSSLGFYSKANNFARLPSSTFTEVMQKVTFPVLSKIQSDKESLMTNYRKLIKISTFVVFPMMVGLSAIASPLILFLLTEKWAQSIVYLQIICFSMMWYPVHAINLNLLQVKGRSDLFLRLEIIKKIMVVIVIFCVVPFGVVGICWGSVFTSIVSLFINTYYTGKLINVGFVRQMKDIMPILINSIIMGASVYMLTLIVPSRIISLLLSIICGFFIYVFLAYFSKSQELVEIVSIIKNKLRKQ